MADYDGDYYYEIDPCHFEPKRSCLVDKIGTSLTDKVFQTTDTEEKDCLYYSWLEFTDDMAYLNITDHDHLQKVAANGCEPEYDGANCWPFTFSNQDSIHRCPNISGLTYPDVDLVRSCTSGNWGPTNFLDCLSDKGYNLIHSHCQPGDTLYGIDCDSILDQVPGSVFNPAEERMAYALRDIYFFGSFASLILLTIALFIFCMFKSLQCPRVHIHKNLVISLMIQCILHIIIFEPFVTVDFTLEEQEMIEETDSKKSYLGYSWSCKLMFALLNYVTMTNIFWAFVEGLFLISRISIAVFSSSTPYWLFYSIGWGIPGVFTIIWALCAHYYHDEQMCWRNFTATPFFAIIMAPICIAVAANLIFLICIIRILITKLHAVSTDEHVQISGRNRHVTILTPSTIGKAMKATVVLLPLLSITSILFIWAPDLQKSPHANLAYRITNACLQVAQGMFVSVLFCFFNGEVRSALIKKWKQLRSETFRYRSSRASSVCVTQSEHLTMMNGNHSRKMSHTSHMSAGTETGTAV